MKKSQDVRVKHTKSQRVWGVLALVALFGCGVMVGLGFTNKSVAQRPVDGVAVKFFPNANIDFTNMSVGESRTHNVAVRVGAPLETLVVKPIDGISGLKVTNDCADVAVVNARGGCDIMVEYTTQVAF